MLRNRWLDPEWYRHLWRRTRWDVRALIVVSALALSGATGFTVVTATADKPQDSTSNYVPVMTTVIQTVQVREHGRTVIKRVPVVKKIYAKPVTVLQTKTVTLADGTVKVVTTPVIRYRPVYRNKLVYVKGKPVTVSQIVTDTAMLTQTQQLTVTNDHYATVVQNNTVVQSDTVTTTKTVESTVTADPVTVTAPPETVTETSPPQTVTETTPPETVTETVTVTTTGP